MQYDKQLTAGCRDVLKAAAMLDPHFKTLTWLPGCVSQDDKKKHNIAFLNQCYEVYRQMYDEPNTRVVREIPVPTKKQQQNLSDRKKFFNRFQVQPQPDAEADAKPIPVPIQNEAEVEKAWSSFKLELKTQVFSYLVCPEPMTHDALRFWNETGRVQFPLMLPCAKYFLSVYAAQASAERIFSTSGKRHRLASGNLEADMLGRLVSSHVNLSSAREYRAKQAAKKLSGAGSSKMSDSVEPITPLKRKLQEVEVDDEIIEIDK